VRVTSSLTNAVTPTAVALGNFDGIHLGHRQVIHPILSPAALSFNQKIYSTVVTFHPHPQEFFSGQSRCLLTPLPEKTIQLNQLGVDQLVLLPFDRELAALSPQQFVEKILIQGLMARRISVGQDFCFGRQRSGTALDLQAIAGTYDIEVVIAPLKQSNGDRISSSAIRQALEAGNLSLANTLLGRSYLLMGQVVQGQQLGRTLGFPTANLRLPVEKFLPRSGVYAVKVQICPTADESNLVFNRQHLGVMNLGYRPTVDGQQQVAEVHLLDWTKDLYDQTLIVSLEKFIRPEQKFASLAALKTQIEADCNFAKAVFAATDQGLSNLPMD
jgi:riboflavin kinase/FMN adenylyltransferase